MHAGRLRGVVVEGCCRVNQRLQGIQALTRMTQFSGCITKEMKFLRKNPETVSKKEAAMGSVWTCKRFVR